MTFELFDPQGEVRITEGRLPHWYQPAVTYFVTFRTEDSMPSEVAEQWYRRRNDWLLRHGINPQLTHCAPKFASLSIEKQQEFHGVFSAEYHAQLDKGHGKCVLRRPELAKIVADGLRHFDGDRYDLGDFVIMPNHVHLLVCLLGATDVVELCRSWKRFTATKINHELNQKGRFWQEESFDHLVRSPEQFEYLRGYIANNGPAAHLPKGHFLHWSLNQSK